MQGKINQHLPVFHPDREPYVCTCGCGYGWREWSAWSERRRQQVSTADEQAGDAQEQGEAHA